MESEDVEPYRIQITIRPEYETLTSGERKALEKALRDSHLGIVRIDEAIIVNLGRGGVGGVPLTIDVWLNIGEGAAAILLAAAVTKGITPIIKVLRKRIARLVAVVHRGVPEEGNDPVTYIVDPPDELEALEAMPADYEVTTRTESRTVVWRDGRWERHESTTRVERGTGGAK